MRSIAPAIGLSLLFLATPLLAQDISGHYVVPGPRDEKGSVVITGKENGYAVVFNLPDGTSKTFDGSFSGNELTLREPGTSATTVTAGSVGVAGALTGAEDPATTSDGDDTSERPSVGTYVLENTVVKKRRGVWPFRKSYTTPMGMFKAKGPVDADGPMPVAKFGKANIELSLAGNGEIGPGDKIELKASVSPKTKGKFKWSIEGDGLEKTKSWKHKATFKGLKAGEHTVKVRFTSKAIGSKHYATATVNVVVPSQEDSVEKVTLQGLTFKSDHGVMTDHDSSWSSGGTKFAEPEWTAQAQHPISHTMDEKVVVELKLNAEPAGATDTEVVIKGSGGGLSFEQKATLKAGENTVTLESKGFPKKIQKVALELDWSIEAAADVELENAQTKTDVYVTFDSPIDAGRSKGITLKRMRKSVEACALAESLDPHQIVRKVISKWGHYNLKVAFWNAWELGEDKKDETDGSLVGADCQTIVRFTRNAIKMVGVPGEAEFVVVYGKVATPAKGEVSVDAKNHMTSPRQYYNDSNPEDETKKNWIACLVDSSGGLNNYEAALRFSHGSKKKYYPGGVNSVLSNADQVIGVFTTMSWIDSWDFSAGPKEPHIHHYR